MSEKVLKALELRKGEANCAQAVAMVFSEDLGLPLSDIERLCSTLGGGFCAGELCGAMAGAMLVQGLKFGQNSAHDASKKKFAKQKGIALMQRLEQEFGKRRCIDILGIDVNTPQGFLEAKPLIATTCANIISRCIEILEEDSI